MYLLFFLLALCVGTCGLAQGINVSATTTIIGNLVSEVGGVRVRVNVVVPMGADPHSFEPRPSSIRALAQTRLLFANGLNLEPYLTRLQAVLPSGARNVSLAEGATNLICITEKQRRDEKLLGSSVHRHGLCDPHLWLDPGSIRIYLQGIQKALTELDPEGRAQYAARTSDYLRRIEVVDHELRRCIAATPLTNRRLVVQHDAFLYAARHYGFEVAGQITNFAGQEKGPRSLVDLAQQMQQGKVRIIATEPQFSATEARTLAEATGARLITLLSDTLTPQVSSYLALIEHNGRTLCEAFARLN
jgi:zinc transport system substrate-binding protein